MVCERLQHRGIQVTPTRDHLGNTGLRIGLGTVEQTKESVALLAYGLQV